MDRMGHSQIQTTQKYLPTLPDADDHALNAFERTPTRARGRGVLHRRVPTVRLCHTPSRCIGRSRVAYSHKSCARRATDAMRRSSARPASGASTAHTAGAVNGLPSADSRRPESTDGRCGGTRPDDSAVDIANDPIRDEGRLHLTVDLDGHSLRYLNRGCILELDLVNHRH